MAVDAIARRLGDIGEKVKSIGADTLGAAPEVDWVAAKAMRTIIAHEYEDLDVGIVAATVRGGPAGHEGGGPQAPLLTVGAPAVLPAGRPAYGNGR